MDIVRKTGGRVIMALEAFCQIPSSWINHANPRHKGRRPEKGSIYREHNSPKPMNKRSSAYLASQAKRLGTPNAECGNNLMEV